MIWCHYTRNLANCQALKATFAPGRRSSPSDGQYDPTTAAHSKLGPRPDTPLPKSNPSPVGQDRSPRPARATASHPSGGNADLFSATREKMPTRLLAPTASGRLAPRPEISPHIRSRYRKNATKLKGSRGFGRDTHRRKDADRSLSLPSRRGAMNVPGSLSKRQTTPEPKRRQQADRWTRAFHRHGRRTTQRRAHPVPRR
jgi:hypothetical protein